MRKLLIIPALLIAGICFGQNLELPYDTITGRIDYKQITELSNGTQDVIFSNVPALSSTKNTNLLLIQWL